MSSSIWTECAGDSEIGPLRATPWRAVESQHQVSTRKLVDSDAEQALLETLLEAVKPPDVSRGRLHYLLAAPFRYPPLRHGSRFGARHERGIWYGSETLRGVFAEVAYYRLVFLSGVRADLGAVSTGLTTYRARVRTERGVDLTAPAFAAAQAALTSPVRYDATQSVGTAMRAAGVEAFRYHSARDREGAVNLGVLAPRAFGRGRPRDFEDWLCTATPERVEVQHRSWFERSSHVFERSEFLVAGRLPAPAV